MTQTQVPCPRARIIHAGRKSTPPTQSVRRLFESLQRVRKPTVKLLLSDFLASCLVHHARALLNSTRNFLLAIAAPCVDPKAKLKMCGSRDLTDTKQGLKIREWRSIGKQKRFSAEFKRVAVRLMESLSVGRRHLIREHEKLGRTLTEEETVTLLRSLGSKSVSRSDEEQQVGSAVRFCNHTFPLRSFIRLRRRPSVGCAAISWSR